MPDDTTDELERVSAQVAGRLEARGISLTGREKPEELADIEEAVERFELAVESRGGDLMIDEAPRGQTAEPDNADFALPLRSKGESPADYIARLTAATVVVRRHREKA